MNIETLKDINLDAVSAEGRYEIMKIKSAMLKDKELPDFEVAKATRDESVAKIDEQKDMFFVNYKDARDIIFNDLKSKNVEAVDFIYPIGKKGEFTCYAVGLYDLAMAKSLHFNAKQMVEKGMGIVITVVMSKFPMDQSSLSKHVFKDTINLFDNPEMFGVQPIAIRSYKNFISGINFDYDEDFWNLVEKNLQAEKQENVAKEVPEEEKKYVSTLHVIDRMVLRPYTKIGHFNEAVEGQRKDTDIER